MSDKDVRWEQRFSNYRKAFTKFQQAIHFVTAHFSNPVTAGNAEDSSQSQNDLIKQGLIQSFEYTHELAWNVMKDYAIYQGNSAIGGSRDATREAFSLGLIENGNSWMEMIQSRNKTSHTYNEETADEIFGKIISDYYPAMRLFVEKMDTIRSRSQDGLF